MGGPKMIRSLTINGQFYTEQQLIEYCKNQLESDVLQWQKDNCAFILEWLDNSATVMAKTSGSTGKPKVLALKKQSMINSAMATGQFFNWQKGAKALLCLSPNFIAGKMMIVRAFVWQLNLIMVEPNGRPLQNITEKIDFAAMIPLQVRNTINQKHNIDKINQLLIGGGAIDTPLQQQLQPLKTKCFLGYGMTETVSHVAIRALNGKQQSEIYKAMENVTFAIDKRGCLCVDAPNIVTETLITNDMVELIDNWCFKWLGRFDNVVNSGGIKLFPEQIEAKIAPFINMPFYLVGVPDTHLGEMLVMYIECPKQRNKNIDILKNKMQQVLSPYEIPRKIAIVENFEYTATGKIKRIAVL